MDKDQTRVRTYTNLHGMPANAHLFVQLDLLWFACNRHESQEPPKLLPAARVLQLQAQLKSLQSLFSLAVY